MTKTEVLEMGFQLTKHYRHDEWETYRYTKGVIQVEFTYVIETGELDTRDVTIDEVVGKKMDLKALNSLDEILNK
ncbi:MAG: hypothetical protein CMD31_00075 [Flavobacteriales bacterium]|nr:hypothetical protein [Flavobacteriales bacterium]|tara:strand:- start:645 stop:869 length:225 start_codon:yes stop_codon:yes gene_type:complete